MSAVVHLIPLDVTSFKIMSMGERKVGRVDEETALLHES